MKIFLQITSKSNLKKKVITHTHTRSVLCEKVEQALEMDLANIAKNFIIDV